VLTHVTGGFDPLRLLLGNDVALWRSFGLRWGDSTWRVSAQWHKPTESDYGGPVLLVSRLMKRRGKGDPMSRMLATAIVIFVACVCVHAEAKKAPPLPVPSLRIAVSPQQQSFDSHFLTPVQQSLNGCLLSRGYRVVQDALGADLIAKLTVQSQQEQQVFNFSINGQQRVTFSVHVGVVFVAPNGAEVVDQLETTFSASDGDVNQKAIARLVEQIGLNGRMNAYAANLARAEHDRTVREEQSRKERERAEARARVAEEKRQKEQQLADAQRQAEEAKRADQIDEDDWRASGAAGCSAAASLTDCDSVRAYVKAHPSGRHIGEATQSLNDAEPKLVIFRAEQQRKEEQQRDEAAWQEAIGPELGMSKCEGCKVAVTHGNLASCQRPMRSDACATVEKYLSNNPSGAHAAEAKRVISASASKIASLRKQEEAREQAGESIQQLCTVLGQLAQLETAERLQRRVDAESGTVSLYQRRQNATARVLLRDQRQKLSKDVARAGIRFDQRRDCASDE
jgi:hypothetical protein